MHEVMSQYIYVSHDQAPHNTSLHEVRPKQGKFIADSEICIFPREGRMCPPGRIFLALTAACVSREGFKQKEINSFPFFTSGRQVQHVLFSCPVLVITHYHAFLEIELTNRSTTIPLSYIALI